MQNQAELMKSIFVAIKVVALQLLTVPRPNYTIFLDFFYTFLILMSIIIFMSIALMC